VKSGRDRPALDDLCLVAVIPAFRVEREIAAVLASLPSYIRHIVVVDDASPDLTGQVVERYSEHDPRVVLLRHQENQGVGGAMITGFRRALEFDPQIVIKIDGDGQMSADHIPDLLDPLVRGKADMTKGNRFRDLQALAKMPVVRRVGNAGLSFLVKAATGYWNCFDPANGFIALRGDLLRRLPLDRLDPSYFFEVSLLSQAYFLDAVIRDVPMPAHYGDEVSSLSVWRVLSEFPPRLVLLLIRRLLLKYIVYEFSMGSVYLITGLPLLLFGLAFGGTKWVQYSAQGIPAPTGTVMLATLSVILGFQLLLSGISVDLQSVPHEPTSRPLSNIEE
jgi:dolichol-phosphate mannosyltransferase